jgi:hypothetical protein
MAMSTIRPGDVPRTSANQPLERGTRALGAVVAAAVALVPATAGLFLAGTLFLAIGIPAAAIAGALLGPSIRSTSANGGATVLMATLSVALGDAIVVVWLILAAGADASGLRSGAESVWSSSIHLGILGLAAVGIPMLLITIPCAIVWAVAVRSLVAREPSTGRQ